MGSISLWAIASAISKIFAGSFSGGECRQRSKGLSSSHGFGAPMLGMSMAAVVGPKLGEAPIFGRALSVTFRRRRALASQFAIWLGLSSVFFSSSAFSSSVGYGLSACASTQSRRVLTAWRGKRMPLRLELPGSSSARTEEELLPRPLDLSCLMPVTVPCSLTASSSTTCNVSKANSGMSRLAS